MKKILAVVFVAFAAVMCLTLVSCGHECEFKPEWSKDATHHWYDCADEECELVSDIAEHTWDNGEVTVSPTKDAEGVRTFTCKVCGYSKTEAIAKCVYSTDWSKNETQHWYSCTVHTDCVSRGEYADHNWSLGEITALPTEATEGIKTFICTDCGQTKEEAIAKCTYSTKWSSVSTHHWHICKEHSDCGSKGSYGEHNWDGGAITTFPTETKKGIKTFTCTDCGYTKKEDIQKCALSVDWSKTDTNHWYACIVHTECETKGSYGEHSWGEGVITVPATEATEGTRIFVCSDCAHTRTEAIAKCVYDSGWSKNDTHHWHGCTSSDYCDNKISYEEHSWDDGVITCYPTKEADGVMKYTCIDCGHTSTKAIKKILTESEWNNAFEITNFNNFHWNEASVIYISETSYNVALDCKFTENKAYIRNSTTGYPASESTFTDTEEVNDRRRNVLSFLNGMISYEDYDYDAEAGAYRANKTVLLKGIPTDDVMLYFDDSGRLIKALYYAIYTDNGVENEIISVITIEYGNVVL